MNKLKNVLAVLLVAQLAAVLGLYWQGQQQQQALQSQELLAFEPAQLTRIAISDGTSNVTLSRVEDRWLLPDDQQLPVDAAQLDSLLAKLHGLQSGWPIATTAAAQQRFEVADDTFQRRIALFTGSDKAGELLVGSSPGFRKVHVRRPGDTAIYSVALNSYELPATGKEWLDKALLGAGTPTAIGGKDYALEKQGETWALAQPGDTILDPAKAEQLAAAFRGLRVLGIAAAGPGDDAVRIAVSGPDGQWDYRFAKAGEDYVVQRSDRDQAFTISQFDYDRITQVDRTQLAMAPETPDDGEAAGTVQPEAADDPHNAAAELAPQPDQGSAEAAGQSSSS